MSTKKTASVHEQNILALKEEIDRVTNQRDAATRRANSYELDHDRLAKWNTEGKAELEKKDGLIANLDRAIGELMATVKVLTKELSNYQQREDERRQAVKTRVS